MNSYTCSKILKLEFYCKLLHSHSKDKERSAHGREHTAGGGTYWFYNHLETGDTKNRHITCSNELHHKDKLCPQNKLYHKDKLCPQNKLYHKDKLCPQNKLYHKDKLCPQNKLYHKNKL